MTAVITPRPGEAVGKDAAPKVRSEITLHPGGGTETHGVGLCGLGEEGLEVMLDHGV